MSTPTAPFVLMDASAGSGKTRNLVKAVLTKLILREPVRSILGITFTNAAAAEMKERLLAQLKTFVETGDKKDPMLVEICAENNLSIEEVANRSRDILQHLLHRYNDLSFSTIDSFTARLVRTFAKDLAMSENFDILLETDELLKETTDLVMDAAGTEPLITEMLVNFVEQKLADEKGWSIENALLEVAKKILEEKHREPLEKLRNLDALALIELRKDLTQKIKEAEDLISETGEEALTLIESEGLSINDFYYAKLGPVNFFNQLKNGNIQNTIQKGSRLVTVLETGNWYGSKLNPSQIASIDRIKSRLSELAIRGNELSIEHGPFILLAKKIIGNLYSFSTLQHLYNTLMLLQEQNNAVPLAIFNGIIHQKLKDEPTAYIYERLGERYRHFFIDEFQDTSRLQWGNLLPLIENSLSESGSALIVGDAKQSIYRWRNGDAEQFIDLSQKAEQGKFNTSVGGYLHRLSHNWRSRANIVNFNNSLFVCLAKEMQGDAYQNLYKNAAQVAAKGNGGLVELREFPTDNYDEKAIAQLLKDIERMRTAGYCYRDIALLVRNKVHGAQLVMELSSRGYPVISADSLFVGNSYEGRLLSALTIIPHFTNDKRYRWYLAEALMQLRLVKPDSTFAFAQSLVDTHPEQIIPEINKHLPGYAEACTGGLDLYSFSRTMCRLAGFNMANNAFVQTYLQAVQDFVIRWDGNAHEFIHWWQDKGHETPVLVSSGVDALQVLTIHKSKGLQYPVVIMPYVTWRLNDNRREDWIPLKDERFGHLDEFLIPLNKTDSVAIGGAYEEKVKKLLSQEHFDAINMLYVACTRAIDCLIMYGKENSNIPTVFEEIKKFTQTQEENRVEEGFYVWGEETLPEKKQQESPSKKPFTTPNSPWQQKLRLATRSPKNWHIQERTAREWGNLVHFALAQITTRSSVPSAIEALKVNGDISDEEAQIIERKIEELMQNPDLAQFFDEDVMVYNEREIIIPAEKNKRPDRLVKTSDGRWLLADYKTGEKSDNHLDQLRKYSRFLAEAGLQVADAKLVYLADEAEVISA